MENFKEEGRPDKRTDLAEITKEKRKKKNKWPGQILQVSGQLAASVNTQYDDNLAIIGMKQYLSKFVDKCLKQDYYKRK